MRSLLSLPAGTDPMQAIGGDIFHAATVDVLAGASSATTAFSNSTDPEDDALRQLLAREGKVSNAAKTLTAESTAVIAKQRILLARAELLCEFDKAHRSTGSSRASSLPPATSQQRQASWR